MENGSESKMRKMLFNEITLIVAVVGVVIGCFIFITEPDTESSIALQLQDARITSQQSTIDILTKTHQNHYEEIKNEIAGFRQEQQNVTNALIKLETIIEERLPPTF